MSDSTGSDCQSLDPLVTPYVDGELAPHDCARVEAHLALCPPCRDRLGVERSVRARLCEERPALCRDRAPIDLVARCQQQNGRTPISLVSGEKGVRPLFSRRRLAPLAAAALVVLAVGTAAIYQATGSSAGLLAAELAADHVKCALLNRVVGAGHGDAEGTDVHAVERWLASTFSWEARLPDAPARAGLELVGSRQCLYGRGTAAHIMYRDIQHQGEMVSVFMLPGQIRPDTLVAALGHEASVWSDGKRTFVLLARRPRGDVQRLAAFVAGSVR